MGSAKSDSEWQIIRAKSSDVVMCLFMKDLVVMVGPRKNVFGDNMVSLNIFTVNNILTDNNIFGEYSCYTCFNQFEVHRE